MSNYRHHYNPMNSIDLHTIQPIDTMQGLGAAVVDLSIEKILSYEEFMRGVLIELIRNRKR